MDFDLEHPLANFKEQQNYSTISELFALESDHMPSPNCFNFSYHSEAISLILQVKAKLGLYYIAHVQFLLFHVTHVTIFLFSSGAAFLQFGFICNLSCYKLLAPFHVKARNFGKHISNDYPLCLCYVYFIGK